MKEIAKYLTLIIIAISFAVYILHDFLIDSEILFYIFVALTIFGIDTFTKWIYNKYIISIFIPDKIPIPNYVRKISNSFISIAAIITGYQIGIGFNQDFTKTFNPHIERLENEKLFIAIFFFILISVFIYTTYGIAYSIKIESKKIVFKLLKELIMKKILTTPFLIIIIALIIMFVPWILTWDTFLPDFSETGQIGDTIGGLTAPFLNGIAAILVFIAFKEQVKANELLRGQFEYDKINTQIDRVSDKNIDLNNLLNQLRGNHQQIYTNQFDNNNYVHVLNEILYFSTDFEICLNLIDNYTEDKKLLWKKLYFLFVIRHKDSFVSIHTELQNAVGLTNNDAYIADIQLQIQRLVDDINEDDKY